MVILLIKLNVHFLNREWQVSHLVSFFFLVYILCSKIYFAVLKKKTRKEYDQRVEIV
jgi:hypothetical protein